MDILNGMAPQKGPAVSMGELEESKSALDSSAMQLLIQELQYDEKCMAAFSSRMSSYEIRLAHQKNDWVSKKLSTAKDAVNKWMDAKALKFEQR